MAELALTQKTVQLRAVKYLRQPNQQYEVANPEIRP
jgi:hypothetical protein